MKSSLLTPLCIIIICLVNKKSTLLQLNLTLIIPNGDKCTISTMYLVTNTNCSLIQYESYFELHFVREQKLKNNNNNNNMGRSNNRKL